MQRFEIEGQTGRSEILVGETLAGLPRRLPAGRVVIITDERVAGLYGDRFPPADLITIGRGESIKTLDTVAGIYDRLVDLEADRSTFVVGIGGGIVGDITGFAASTYMRGLRFGFVATTLLAQVDASVGGKNGVNFKGYKNMVGVFRQPEFVIADIGLLGTLPPAEIACGLAEIVKHACIADLEYFDFIEAHVEAVKGLDPDVMLRLVADSVRIKATVVNADEKEAGRRRLLNFGHTVGHALEKTLRISHGEAVGAGMAVAADFSLHRSMLTGDAAQRLKSLLRRLDLPVDLPFERRPVFEAIKKDKKRRMAEIHMVLLQDIGHAVVETIPLAELENWLSPGL